MRLKSDEAKTELERMRCTVKYDEQRVINAATRLTLTNNGRGKLAWCSSTHTHTLAMMTNRGDDDQNVSVVMRERMRKRREDTVVDDVDIWVSSRRDT